MTTKPEKRKNFWTRCSVRSHPTGSLNSSPRDSAKILALIILAIVATIAAGYYAAPQLFVALQKTASAPTHSPDRLTAIRASQLPTIIQQALADTNFNRMPRESDTAKLVKLAVVNIWATWCPPCRAEMPEFVKFRNQQKPGEVAVILVSADDENTRGDVLSFLKSLNIDFDTFIVGEPAPTFVRQLSVTWAGGLPATFILNQEGEVLQEFVGASTAASLSKLVSDWQTRLAVPH